ncbi:MAG: hypothetical protein PWP68_565 [Rikenellaceae bacterium]|nr:hypothetical protein [Rikenellaceae bacterium]
MGTSKGYLPPKGHLWRDAKRAVTNMVNNNFESNLIGKAVSKYIQATRLGNGSISANKQQVISNAGAKAASFISLAQSKGFNEALNQVGLKHLIGKSNEEIYMGLLDYFTGNGSSLDEFIVRDSMAELMKELFLDVTDDKDFGELINELDINKFIKDLIIKFVQKDFLANFSEKIEGKCNSIDEYKNAEKNIKDFIRLKIDSCYTVEELSEIDWNGVEGINFIKSRCSEVLRVFEVYMEG